MTVVGVTVAAQWGRSDIRMRISQVGGGSDAVTFDAPVAPRRVTYGGFENAITETERVGRVPLMRARARKARTMSMEVPVFRHDKDGRLQPIGPLLRTLEDLAARKRVKVHYDDHSSRCEWAIQTMTVESTHRHKDDDAITAAMVTLEFVEAERLVSAGPVEQSAGGGGASAGWKTHRLREGDTPRSLSERYYDGDPKWWKKILDANGLTRKEFKAHVKRGMIISIPRPTWLR